jgi:hypothetical protein
MVLTLLFGAVLAITINQIVLTWVVGAIWSNGLVEM